MPSDTRHEGQPLSDFSTEMASLMTAGIEGKIIAITGASSGIGEAAAFLFAERGAKVALGARGLARLEALSARLTEAGHEAIRLCTDVRRRDDVAALVKLACERYGRLDILINNAGIGGLAPLDDCGDDQSARRHGDDLRCAGRAKNLSVLFTAAWTVFFRRPGSERTWHRQTRAVGSRKTLSSRYSRPSAARKRNYVFPMRLASPRSFD